MQAYLSGHEGRLSRSLKSLLGSALMDEYTHVGEPLTHVVIGRPVHFGLIFPIKPYTNASCKRRRNNTATACSQVWRRPNFLLRLRKCHRRRFEFFRTQPRANAGHIRNARRFATGHRAGGGVCVSVCQSLRLKPRRCGLPHWRFIGSAPFGASPTNRDAPSPLGTRQSFLRRSSFA